MHAELRSNRHIYEWGRYWAEVQPPPQLLPQQTQSDGGAGGGGCGSGGAGGGGGTDPGRPDTALCTVRGLLCLLAGGLPPHTHTHL